MKHILIPDISIPGGLLPGDAVVRVRGYRQTTTYSCGHAAAATVLKAAGLRPGRDLWDAVAPTPERGADNGKVSRALRGAGIPCRSERLSFGRLRDELLKGNLVLTTVRKLHYPDDLEHWVIVCGANLASRRVLVLGYAGFPPGRSRRWLEWREMRFGLPKHHPMLVCGTGLADQVDHWPLPCEGGVRIS